MFAEDLSIFFADFGVEATLGSHSATVLLDTPDANILGDRVQTTNYLITFAATDLPTIKHGDAITVAGVDYTVQMVNNIEDGAFKSAQLEKVRL